MNLTDCQSDVWKITVIINSNSFFPLRKRNVCDLGNWKMLIWPHGAGWKNLKQTVKHCTTRGIEVVRNGTYFPYSLFLNYEQ